MTDKELRRLSRKDLLQMLVDQGRELKDLQEKYAQVQCELNERKLKIEKAGSIAEASLQLNGVFQAAQAACEQYTESVKELSIRQQVVCEEIEAQSRKKARALIRETRRKCSAMEKETQQKCAEMLRKAEMQIKDKNI